MVLDAAYFTEDKTITCTVTYGYSTLTESATADTVCKFLSRLGTSINVLKAFFIDACLRYGYSSKFRLLYLSAVQEVVVATTSGADVDLICDVTNTASQVSEITITYDGTAYTTYVTV